jgi:hypothetical protein
LLTSSSAAATGLRTQTSSVDLPPFYLQKKSNETKLGQMTEPPNQGNNK